ncbi:uncharacterized protein LOC110114542 [Dendrobium catenatum]|uniref:uncharacterized protein LOC110114542 n=1 Tax=Dendrobium catenatum TaxID=906689 RepID=UPI0009F6FE65|nr:uncharacterized protein LOC110114542 [Dendrobium catenatum]
MSIFISSCLLFVANSLMFLFRFIALHVIRKTFNVSELAESNYVNKDEEKGRSFSFKFQYQICNDNKDTPVKLTEENEFSVISTDILKYQVCSEKDFRGTMGEPKTMNFQVHESFMELEEYNNFDGDESIRFLAAEDFQKPSMEAMAKEKADDDQVLSVLNMMQLKKQFSEVEKFNSVCSEVSSVSFSDFDSDSEPSSDCYSVRDHINDSDWGSSFSDGYFGDSEHDSEIREASVNSRNKLAEGKLEFFLERSEGEEANDDDSHAEKKKHVSNAENNNNRETYSNETTLKVKIQSSKRETRKRQLKLEEESKNKVSFVEIGGARLDFSGEADSEPRPKALDRDEEGKNEDDSSKNDSSNSVYVSYERQQTIDNTDNEQKKPELEEEKSKVTFTLDLDEDEFDEIWEHQDLIMQLKMELKKVRAVGLPTILEESESPSVIEDSKSTKLDEKLSREDPMDELHNMYKCYKEGMRKFDILNYQKMYATGFLQLRDPLELNITRKSMFSAFMSHLSQSFLPFSKKKSNCDPSEKYIKELRCDLETVYVGQICLSWEFLRWQSEKFHKLTDSDLFISHRYNNVAAEFQQFTVTLQRFVENEIFQGPRLANYVKQRCILRNLLQLPVIKEDFLKEKMEKGTEEDGITREMLEDIMEEAMRIFWEFVKAEKYETPRFMKGLVENHVELEDPSDYEFFVDIQASLQKKEKKLKNLLKEGNCMVKMLKRKQEGRSSHDLFFTQIDLKIVSRVLRMSRITSDQLIWCQKKLSKIIFSGKKIHREPSFLLFPC